MTNHVAPTSVSLPSPQMSDWLAETFVYSEFVRRGGRTSGGTSTAGSGPSMTTVSGGVSINGHTASADITACGNAGCVTVSASTGFGGGTTIRDLAIILGEKLQRQLERAKEFIANIDGDNSAQETLLAQVEVQILSVMMNAFMAMMNSYGGALATAAEGRGAIR